MVTISEVAKIYGLTYHTAWRVLKKIEPAKEVKRGDKTYLFYDETEVENLLNELGYLDKENTELLKRVLQQ